MFVMRIKQAKMLRTVITLWLYTGIANARTDEDQWNTSEISNSLSERCFYRPPTDCPQLDPKSSECGACERIKFNQGYAAFCCNTNMSALESDLSCIGFPHANISYIHIRNATLDVFNASETRWRMLTSLAITDGRINRVKGQFLRMTPTQCLNLSNNALIEVESNSLIRLSQLTTLDLSYNNLTNLPTLNTINNREFWLDISGTNTLLCQDIYQYINKPGEKQITFNRENDTVCSAVATWHWFNTTEQVPLTQVIYLSLLQTECPKGDGWQCQCDIKRLDIIEGKPPTHAVNVDCSGMQLTELPKKLPQNTISLNVSCNNITVLDDLSTNLYYEDLREFYADYNNISSINKLEGSKFLDNYALLSLRYNKITSLPTYILSPSAHNKNFLSSRNLVKLGGNKLHCDCNTAKYLKAWLQTRILDADEVMCGNVKEKVIDLEPSKMYDSQSVVRLLGVQDNGISSMAGKSNAKIAM
ncbi:protein halfway isoform X2 [Pseudomyrmex gracilis]|uniref:protein halfway isoform X2 n=1 Tax=Pseudomyrmex gracilis TaxID=219809 RepID=UPI0009956BD5|nr:protein halfway isoform X2 [Pseudomyrmex gracilis]